MDISYDTKADAMYIKFKDGKFKRNKEIEEGIIVDLAADGGILGIEVLDVSTKFKPKELAKVNIEMPLHLAGARK